MKMSWLRLGVLLVASVLAVAFGAAAEGRRAACGQVCPGLYPTTGLAGRTSTASAGIGVSRSAGGARRGPTAVTFIF